MHYLLMALVAMTAVASFEAVGSILVVAMLIMPAGDGPSARRSARARWCCSPSAIGVLAAVIGYVLGVWLDTNLAGMMTVAAAGLYGLAVLFSPRYGIVSTLVRNLQTSLRVVREDLLAMLYRIEELRAPRRLAPAEAAARRRRRAARPLGPARPGARRPRRRGGRPARAHRRAAATRPGNSSARTACGKRTSCSTSACRSTTSTSRPTASSTSSAERCARSWKQKLDATRRRPARPRDSGVAAQPRRVSTSILIESAQALRD